MVDIIQNELNTRDYISTSENKNIFIEAGAGAGKSTSLVFRVYYSLAEGIEANRIREEIITKKKTKQEVIDELNDFINCDNKEIAFRKKLINEIDDIVSGAFKGITAKDIYAITFTNKATEELRAKIVKFLSDESKCTPQEINRKKLVLKDIDNIHISTIHKFCEDILKENAIKAGLSPDFVPVIDEDEEEILNDVIRTYFRNFRHWPEFEKYDSIGVKRRDIKEGIVKTFRSFLSTADRITDKKQIYRCNSFEGDGLQEYRDSIRDLLDAIDDFIETYPKNAKRGTQYKTKGDLSSLGYEYGQSIEERNEVIDKLMLLSESKWYKNVKADEGKVPIISSASDDVKDEILSSLVPLVIEIIDKLNDVYIGIAQLYVDYGFELYNEYLVNRDNDVERLTSNDLVYKTFKLLENNPDVLAKTSSKIKRLYIDEYQDTDSLQYEIAYLIAADRSDCLYLVGDPKQSIYRFRGAEPDVFFNTKKEFADDLANHAIYDLNINFRSNSKIIEWVNKRYKDIELIEPSVGYKYSPMIHHSRNTIKDVDYLDEKKLNGFYRFEGVKEEQIKDLILFIKDNYQVREKDIYRPIQFKDIMVLMEGHMFMPNFVETFTKNNIPTKVYGQSRFFNTLIVRSFIALYQAILVDADNSLALVESVYTKLSPSLYKDKTYEETQTINKGLLNNLRDKTNKMNAYGKAIFLVEHISLLAKEKHIYQGFEVNFASSKLYQAIETVFSKGYFNGNELIEELNKFLSQSIERESLIEDDVDAVMLINLHKAKGLEAPIVIWVSTLTSDKFADGISDSYKKKILYPSTITNYVRKSKLYQNDVLSLKEDEEFEVARKEYVAVTRPGEAYIFADTPDNTSMFHNENRNYNLEDEDVRSISLPNSEQTDEEIIEEDEPAEDTVEIVDEDEETVIPEPIRNEELDENATDEIPLSQREKEHEYKVASTLPKTISPSSLEESISPTREKYKQAACELPISNRPKSNDVGTILHRALELLIKEEISPIDAVEVAVNENIDLVPSDSANEFKEFFVTCVTAFDKWFDRKDYTLYPEYGFSYFDGKNINNGSIDLLMVNEKECIIIDYKSDEAEYIKDDKVFETTLIEKYEKQLNGYQKVVETLFPNKPIEKKIIYFRRYDDKNHTIDVECLNLK